MAYVAHEAVRNRTTVKRFLHRLQTTSRLSFETWEHRVQEKACAAHCEENVCTCATEKSVLLCVSVLFLYLASQAGK